LAKNFRCNPYAIQILSVRWGVNANIYIQGGQPNLKTKFQEYSRSFLLIFQEYWWYCCWQRCILYSTIYSQA